MKKLLLFIFILFESFTTIALADSMCGANGQFDPGSNSCRPIQSGYGGSSPSSTSKLYGAIAFDPATGASGYSIDNYTVETAKKYALNQCKSKNCEIIGTFETERCGSLSYSSTDGIYGYKTSSRGGRKRLNEKSLKECEKNGGKNCKVIISTCGYDSNLAGRYTGVQTGPVYPR